MKKLIALMLCLVLAVAAFGCNNTPATEGEVCNDFFNKSILDCGVCTAVETRIDGDTSGAAGCRCPHTGKPITAANNATAIFFILVDPPD